MNQSSKDNADFSTKPAIVVDNLTVSYGPVPALLDVSFEVNEGQLIGVIGPEGS